MFATNTGIENHPSDWSQVVNLIELAKMLDDIREAYGHPIIVTSGYRSQRVNEVVGGVPNSWHKHGLAADIRVDWYPSDDFKWRMADLAKVVKRFEGELEEVEYHSGYIHLAIKERSQKGLRKGEKTCNP